MDKIIFLVLISLILSSKHSPTVEDIIKFFNKNELKEPENKVENPKENQQVTPEKENIDGIEEKPPKENKKEKDKEENDEKSKKYIRKKRHHKNSPRLGKKKKFNIRRNSLKKMRLRR